MPPVDTLKKVVRPYYGKTQVELEAMLADLRTQRLLTITEGSTGQTSFRGEIRTDVDRVILDVMTELHYLDPVTWPLESIRRIRNTRFAVRNSYPWGTYGR